MIVLSDDYDDDYNEFLDRIKKFLNIDSDVFDVDFLFLPEPNFDKNPNDENIKGFKVTYHFEEGMNKPEIRIEGDFDEKKLQEYFKSFNASNFPQFKQLGPSRKKQAIDVGTLSLQPNMRQEKFNVKDLYYEINVHEDLIDVILEAPGIEKGHILLSLNEEGRILKVSLEVNFVNVEKEIQLPFDSTMDDYVLDVNNGIVSIIMKKKK